MCIFSRESNFILIDIFFILKVSLMKEWLHFKAYYLDNRIKMIRALIIYVYG